MRLRWVAALSLLFTYGFFFEYLPPFRWVDIPHDLQYYHYPLDDFAFQSLRQGYIPEWDPALNCGMTLAGNSQVAMFYPPMWLVFLSNYGNSRLKYRSMEILVIGHVWLAFLFCFIWLRNRGLENLACLLGSGIFAFSGYMVLQLQHLGLVCAYAWFPFALWGIDQAADSRNWRFLWKVILASAFCFCAGHPPTWFVFCISTMTYALFRRSGWRTGLWAAAAIGYSLLVAMVQLLPTREAAALKAIHDSYGAGIRDPAFLISYLIPNFYDFRLTTPAFTNRGYEYLYLGAPAIFGLAWVLAHPKAARGALPVLAVGIVSAIAVTNPYDVVWSLVKQSELLSQLCRSWYFLAGISLSIAALSASGIDHFLRTPRRSAPPWLATVSMVILTGWSAYLLWQWRPSGPGFPIRWRNALEPAVMLAAFSIAMLALVSATGRTRVWLTLVLLAAVGVDYKVFGTSIRFNAWRQNVDRMFAAAPFPGLDDDTYHVLRAAPEYRIGLDSGNPAPMDLRHYGLTTPQGGDPLVPAQYEKLLAPPGAYYDFVPLDPANHAQLRLFGVKYFMTSDDQPLYPRLLADSEFRLLNAKKGYFRVFEFAKAAPPYGWEVTRPSDLVRQTNWSAEERIFRVSSASGGRFTLSEQFYPGWQATVDGNPIKIERWHEAFQAIVVPPGEHQVAFRFRSSSLRTGAVVSILSLLAGATLLLLSRAKQPLVPVHLARLSG